MRNGLLCIATVVAMTFCINLARAQTTLVYSFESPPVGNTDGFGPNGGGTYTQDVIGATDGLNSLKATIAEADTFVGAITGVLPAAINDPPGVNHVTFDMTIAPGGEFTGGGFAVIGVTIWGCTQGGGCGNPVQFSDIEHVEGKAAGTYPVQIDLTSAANFLPGQSFNQIFGLSGSGSPLIPTHFQFFFNKSANPGNVMTVYLDNVRVTVPEPATFGLIGVGAVVIGAFGRRHRLR